MKSSNTPTTSPTFEEALASLEAIVSSMESSDLPLEDIIGAYEKGSSLLNICETRIAEARLRIEKITATAQGGKLEPLDPEDSSPPNSSARSSAQELF